MEACCQDRGNREVAEDKRELRDGVLLGMLIERCKVCGRRHYEFSVEPGRMFAQGG